MNTAVEMEADDAAANPRPFQCTQCFYAAATKNRLDKHFNEVHLKLKPIKCQQCDSRFSRKCSLEEHIRNAHKVAGSRQYSCTECGFKTASRSSIESHAKSIHKLKVFPCALCGLVASTSSELGKHKKNMHNMGSSNEECHMETGRDSESDLAGRRPCDYSTGKITIVPESALGTQSDVSTRQYACPKCSFKTLSRTSIESHTKKIHQLKVFPCALCGLVPLTGSELSQHKMKAHNRVSVHEEHQLKPGRGSESYIAGTRPDDHSTGKITIVPESALELQSDASTRQYACPKCSFRTQSRSSIESHAKSIHRLKVFPCALCGLVTLTGSELNKHKKSEHNKSISHEECQKKPLKDSESDLVGVRRGDHSRRITIVPEAALEIQSVSLEVGSSNPGTQSSDLTVTKPLKNDLSSKRWKTIQYTCPICQFKIANKIYIQLHAAQEHKKKLLPCTVCEFVALKDSELADHKLTEHRIEKETVRPKLDQIASREQERPTTGFHETEQSNQIKVEEVIIKMEPLPEAEADSILVNCMSNQAEASIIDSHEPTLGFVKSEFDVGMDDDPLATGGDQIPERPAVLKTEDQANQGIAKTFGLEHAPDVSVKVECDVSMEVDPLADEEDQIQDRHVVKQEIEGHQDASMEIKQEHDIPDFVVKEECDIDY